MFGHGNTTVEVATSGQYSFTQFKDQGEVYLAIVQPTILLRLTIWIPKELHTDAKPSKGKQVKILVDDNV